MKTILRGALIAIAAIVLTTIGGAATYAANNTNVTQVINGGTLTTDIRDASKVSVTNPTFALSALTFSFSCQTSTGAIGTDSQRLYVDNPGSANNGWTLTMAATGGITDSWKNTGVTQTFDFNDPTTAGCADGADADSRPGQMTVNPSAGTLTADCTSCTSTAITKGTSSAYSQGALDSITLLTAASGSDDNGRWYLTGATVSQTIPAEQSVDSYTINMTITVTAS